MPLYWKNKKVKIGPKNGAYVRTKSGKRYLNKRELNQARKGKTKRTGGRTGGGLLNPFGRPGGYSS